MLNSLAIWENMNKYLALGKQNIFKLGETTNNHLVSKAVKNHILRRMRVDCNTGEGATIFRQ